MAFNDLRFVGSIAKTLQGGQGLGIESYKELDVGRPKIFYLKTEMLKAKTHNQMG